MKGQEINRDLQYHKQSDEGAMPMPGTALNIQVDEQDFIRDMAEYIKKLKDQAPDVAQKKAIEALIRTGVLTEDGKIKESIVSWE